MSEKCKILESIFDGVGDGILFCDANGIIQMWSKGLERIFGYNKNEAIGKSLDIIIPENLQQKHWNGFYKALEKHQTK